MIKEYNNFDIIEKKGKADNFIWGLPFLHIKEHILGKKFNLSLNLVDESTAQELNKNYRQKDYYPNILTFPLEINSGEIYMCKKVARTQHKDFGLSYHNYIILLFIHGCLHLKGVNHDTKKSEENMVRLENELLEKFKL
ncbi:MAG: putative rRNA maturation factor [Patescibacteria group bacterium]|nr:putative rRNA maturation factor [Patescibacteria group bacterium]